MFECNAKLTVNTFVIGKRKETLILSVPQLNIQFDAYSDRKFKIGQSFPLVIS
jgi:hypothetical protein